MSDSETADPINALLRLPHGGIPGDITIEVLEEGPFDAIASGANGHLCYTGPLVDVAAHR